MSELSQAICEACRVDAPRLSDEELQELHPQISEWQVIDVDGIKQLKREFTFKNFIQAMAFANKVGELAEAEGHHPAILVEWGKVNISWWTHKINGLHKNDVIMAAKTDQLV